MQIVLSKDVPKLGYRGDVVTVKRGYFNNFLMPNGLAEVLTKSLAKLIESRQEKILVEKEKLMDNAKEVLEKLKGLKITLKRKTTKAGKLYAAITEKDVIAAVEEAANVRLEKDYIKMEHFKDLGEHEVLIHLGEKLEDKITVVVESE
jgi:large subunit ribosomal protein L9